MKTIISPSLLSADFANLMPELQMINESEAEYLHIDMMDGVFVPNISFGFPVLQCIKPHLKKPMDVHLMIEHPEKFISEVQALGARIMTVHQEACVHLHRVIQQIKDAGMMAGVTLNPATPVSTLEDILPYVDLVMLMSVNPGFGGQTFIPQTLKKVKQLREMIDAQDLHCLIEVDGGVNLTTGQQLIDAGANMLVAGNAVFKANDPIKMIHDLGQLTPKE
ncbi:MAG TPA: ribulose-phosphate 3-epimerase [Bacteroidaceae bacterium]|nr:ribulose-phosphate 3-epimerase [Bacteroidaceae bacterium]